MKIYVEEFYDGFNHKQHDNYYEIFMNPTQREINDTKKVDEQKSIRGIIDSKNNMYIWTGTILHDEINKYTTKSIPVDTSVRFRYSPEDGWLFTNFNNSFKKTICNFKDKLVQIGNTNKSVELYGEEQTFLKRHDRFKEMIQEF